MPKIVTIHQPNYLPWIGLFSKIKHSHCLIIGDTYFLGGHSTFNRNKVRTTCGWNYLTIPIGHKFEGIPIYDITSPPENHWKQIHWKMIHDNYSKTEFFSLHQDFFNHLYHHDFKYVWQMNEEIIFYLLKCFDIEVEVIKASDIALHSDLEKTDYMIALLKAAGADIYLSGPSGRDYLEKEKFVQNDITLKFFNFQHPVYKQRYPGFEPNMAAIDLLFNTGPAAKEIIGVSGSTEEYASGADRKIAKLVHV